MLTPSGVSLSLGRPLLAVVAVSVGAILGSYPLARSALLYRRDGLRAVTVAEFAAGRVPVGSYVKLKGVGLRTGEFSYEKRGRRGARTEEEYTLLLDPTDPAARKVVAFRQAVADLQAALREKSAAKATAAFAAAGEASDVKPDRFVLVHRSERLEPGQEAFADERAETRAAEASSLSRAARAAEEGENEKVTELRKFVDEAAVLAGRTVPNLEVTGTVETIPGDVAADVRERYGVNDPLAVNPGTAPQPGMIAVLAAGILGLVGTAAFVWRAWRIERSSVTPQHPIP